jgi:hypothetical protein
MTNRELKIKNYNGCLFKLIPLDLSFKLHNPLGADLVIGESIIAPLVEYNRFSQGDYVFLYENTKYHIPEDMNNRTVWIKLINDPNDSSV